MNGATDAIAETNLPLDLVRRGKVRDIYDAGDDRLLLVASDRISAYDHVLSPPIPDKGEVLTQLTAWWLARVGDLTHHHLISADPEVIAQEIPELDADDPVWPRRSLLVRRTRPLPIECVVRGYLAGSAWREYRELGTLAGEPLPEGLVESVRLAPPLFSPATKAENGHDENITYADVRRTVGDEVAAALRERSIALYGRGRTIAERQGIIVADTKFEFGRADDGRLLLIDEVLTPDSSRFWPRERYEPGRSQPSLDKQPVRDYLDDLAHRGGWDHHSPPPPLPDDVVEATSERYRSLFRRLTGYELEAFPVHSPEVDRPDDAA
ncbi:MAG: phosphoribosylaminoimidazolesuccinocarboxamide synthase [Gemmatimonadota bacterium]